MEQEHAKTHPKTPKLSPVVTHLCRYAVPKFQRRLKMYFSANPYKSNLWLTTHGRARSSSNRVWDPNARARARRSSFLLSQVKPAASPPLPCSLSPAVALKPVLPSRSRSSSSLLHTTGPTPSAPGSLDPRIPSLVPGRRRARCTSPSAQLPPPRFYRCCVFFSTCFGVPAPGEQPHSRFSQTAV